MTEPTDVFVGQSFQITLQSMVGSTGYGWYLSKLKGGAVLLNVTTRPSPGIGPTLHIFDFLAVEVGPAHVEVKLMAPWRPGQPAKTEIYDYKITEPTPTPEGDIEAALKSKSFVDSTALIPNSGILLKYSAPMCQTTTMMDYAAPMAYPGGILPAPAVTNLAYSAPMACPGGFTPIPSVTSLAYSAPMAYPGGILPAPAVANLAYSAPMCWTNSAVGTLYSAPMSYSGVNAASIMQPYAAPWTYAAAQPGVNALATIMAAYMPAVQYGAYQAGINAATVMVAYAPPVQYGANANSGCSGNSCSPVYPVYAAPVPGSLAASMVGPLYNFPTPVILYAAPVTRQGCC